MFDTRDTIDPAEFKGVLPEIVEDATVSREGKVTLVRLRLAGQPLTRLADDGNIWSLAFGEDRARAAEAIAPRRGVDERGQNGVVAAYLVGAVLAALVDAAAASPETAWRCALGSCLVPVLAQTAMRDCLVESPRWLLARRGPSEARAAAGRLWGTVEAELFLADVGKRIRESGDPWIRLDSQIRFDSWTNQESRMMLSYFPTFPLDSFVNESESANPGISRFAWIHRFALIRRRIKKVG